jgi:hypothetical protein
MFKTNSSAFIDDQARLLDVETYELPTNRVVSSDSYVISPSSTMLGSFGYDMVSCLIPIDADFTSIENPEWQTRITEGSEILDRNPYMRSDRILKIDEFPELVFKVQVRENGSVLRLEFNPSKIKHGPTELGTLEDIRYGIKLACARLSQDVLPEWSVNRETGEIYKPSSWPANWETAVRITRLDVTFDFVPDSPQRLLDSLLKVSPKYNMKVWAIYFKGKLESLTIPYGKRNGRIVLYNKHAQDSRFPEGTIRFEVQARNQMLKKHGLIVLSQITDNRAIELLETRLGLALWDTPICDLGNRAEAIEGKQIPWSRKIQLLGYLEARENGLDLGIPERTKKQYEKEIRELSLT